MCWYSDITVVDMYLPLRKKTPNKDVSNINDICVQVNHYVHRQQQCTSTMSKHANATYPGEEWPQKSQNQPPFHCTPNSTVLGCFVDMVTPVFVLEIQPAVAPLHDTTQTSKNRPPLHRVWHVLSIRMTSYQCHYATQSIYLILYTPI